MLFELEVYRRQCPFPNQICGKILVAYSNSDLPDCSSWKIAPCL
jgi:hypothetical protein